jgi:acyl-CoA synthetase (AMP-forming)/AMP-acid ligase II/3-hydroxymyristoyl/3-hydroxydecanoyl-(acyl carrier protein) dehydratase
MPKASDMLSALATPRPMDQVIGWRAGKPVSYGEFLSRTRAWHALASRLTGQNFALYLADSVEFAAALFGAWQARKTIYLSGDVLPTTCANLHKDVNGFLGDFAPSWFPHVPSNGDAATPADFSGGLDPEFTGLVLYTSGTTGAPQAIKKKLSQMATEIAGLERGFGDLVGQAEIVATVSHQHIYGLLFKVLWPFTSCRVIHSRSLSFLTELAAEPSEHDYILVSTPAHLKRLPESADWMANGRRPRVVFSSGGPLPFATAKASERLLGSLPIEVYGSSETGGVAWRRQEGADHEVWIPFPDVMWRIDPSQGVLVVSSPHLPDDKWFRTADRAVSAGGGFVLQGRVDQIVKIEEKRISLTAIEEHLAGSSWIRDCRVIVFEQRRRRVAAFVVLSAAGRRQLKAFGKLQMDRSLREQLRGSVDPVALPRIWRYVAGFPVNSQGKTTHAELLALISGIDRATQPLERLVDKTNERAVFELIPPVELVYFDGHFSDAPILPGVAQIDWAITYGRRCFDLPPVFRGIQALKFQRVIPPETPITLELVHDTGRSSLTFKITSESGAHASGRILFGATDV